MKPKPQDSALVADLKTAVADDNRISERPIDRAAWASDASHFLLTPQVIASPNSGPEVARILAVATTHGIPVTFRSGGTSLSGQAVSDGILVDTRRNFRAIEVLDDGQRVRVQPGVTLRAVNARLTPYGRKLGPDPASEVACTVGGIVANNSSGMACGTTHNAYRTLESAVLVLPSGTIIDTSAPDADQLLRHHEPGLHEGLRRLRDRVRSNEESVATIERLFSMKNTMGYGLNAFLDFETPVEMLTRLVVGSEGTLAFVAEATFRTIPVMARSATSLLLFPDMSAALERLPDIVATAPATVEFLDASSLRVGQRDLASDLRGEIRNHAALLLEYQAPSAVALAEQLHGAGAVLDALQVLDTPAFTFSQGERAQLWKMRKGLYASVAGARPAGTMALLEDIVVPVPALLQTCTQLTELFARHGYDGSVIFGHAKDGNVHFMLNERFDVHENVDRYHRFSEDMVDLVLAQGGSLKAEHGTGRMMAPYVRRQYGDELYDVMVALKALIDPRDIMNPGVLLSEDQSGPTRDLKARGEVDDEINRCVECGFCEPVCPSRDLTTTPRQRIAVRRAMQGAEDRGDSKLLSDLAADHRYEVIDTCAADGMCQVACPVGINTGDLVKRLRAEDSAAVDRVAWKVAAGHWGLVTRSASAALTAAARAPEGTAGRTSRALQRIAGAERVPLWTPDLPAGAARLDRTATRSSGVPGAAAGGVLFASCTGAVFGAEDGADGMPGRGVAQDLITLCKRAGTDLVIPTRSADLCCGTPWRSKGMRAGYERMMRQVIPALWDASDLGTLPIIVDASSCGEGLRQLANAAAAATPRYAALRFVDATEYTLAHLMPRLRVPAKLASITLHPTCATTRDGGVANLEELAGMVADEVVIPAAWGCCGFAGDRGMLHPELTRTATADEAEEVRQEPTVAYASTNRTCELGMSRATGQRYQHLLEIVEALTVAI